MYFRLPHLLVSMVLLFAGIAIFPQPGMAGARVCRLAIQPATWFEKVQATTDRTSLSRFFRATGFQPVKRSYLLMARVVPGVGQPAFQYYSLGDTGFVYSPGEYWPASTIKIWAAAGALMTLRKYKLDGTARLHFSDRIGRFRGSVARMYRRLTNKNYDRLMLIAGLDALNGLSQKQREQYGLPRTVLQIAYGGSGTLNPSPTIYYRHKGRVGVIPLRRSKLRFPKCPRNCTSLFEIQEILRRIVLHNELPRSERFPWFSSDARRWRQSLLRYGKWIRPAISRIWGRKARIYNKTGSVPGYHMLDNAYIIAPDGRYLITLASPWTRRIYLGQPVARRELTELAKQSLQMLQQEPTSRVSLQTDAGQVLRVRATVISRSPRRYRINVQAPDIATLRAWDGTRSLRVRQQRNTFTITDSFTKAGKHIIILQGENRGRPVAYRAFALTIPSKGQKLRCQSK